MKKYKVKYQIAGSSASYSLTVTASSMSQAKEQIKARYSGKPIKFYTLQNADLNFNPVIKKDNRDD